MYETISENQIVRMIDGVVIEQDPANPDYIEYLKWDNLRRGYNEITMRQCRLYLLSIGKLGDIEAALNSLPSPAKEVAIIEWEYSSAVKRDNPLTGAIGAALGWNTPEQIDYHFKEASKIV